MKFFIAPFRDNNGFAITPTLMLEIMRCGEKDCQKTHGYELRLQWLDFGIGAVLMFQDNDFC